MRDLDASLIAKKNALYVAEPWVWLLELELAGGGSDYFAAYDDDVDWNGQTWEATGMAVELIQQDGTGRLSELNVHMSNVLQELSAYVEANAILGRDVTLYLVNTDHLDVTTDVLDFEYRVNRVVTTSVAGVIELGHDDLIALQLPWQRYYRDRCRFVYRGNRCGFPDDEFDLRTKQDLSIGPTSARTVMGYYVENQGNADVLDASYTLEDYLSMQVASGGAFNWIDATRTGPAILRYMNAGVDVNTKWISVLSANNAAYLVVRNGSDANDWVAIGGRYSGSVEAVYINTVNGSSAVTQIRAGLPYSMWRIAQDGSTWTFYDCSPGGSWMQRGQVSNTMGSHLYVGLVACTLGSGAGQAQYFDYLRFDADGEATTCDHLFESGSGCSGRYNTRRYGGCPALRTGRLYGI